MTTSCNNFFRDQYNIAARFSFHWVCAKRLCATLLSIFKSRSIHKSMFFVCAFRPKIYIFNFRVQPLKLTYYIKLLASLSLLDYSFLFLWLLWFRCLFSSSLKVDSSPEFISKFLFLQNSIKTEKIYRQKKTKIWCMFLSIYFFLISSLCFCSDSNLYMWPCSAA